MANSCVSPFAKPLRERLEVFLGLRRVGFQNRPFLFVGAAFFVQDLRGNVQLAHVVEQCRPTQFSKVVFAEAHLLANQLGVGAHSFGMAASHAVVFG